MMISVTVLAYVLFQVTCYPRVLGIQKITGVALEYPQELAESIRKTSFLTSDADIQIHRLTKDSNSLVINGVEYSFEHLEPFAVLASDVTMTVDNATISSPFELQPLVWSGTNNGTEVFMVKDMNGYFEFISIRDASRNVDMDFVPVNAVASNTTSPYNLSNDLFAGLSKTDYNLDLLNQINADGLSFRDKEVYPDNIRNLRSRSLQTNAAASTCQSFAVIELAMVFDSSFCSKLGGSSAAIQRTQQIVAYASTYYQVPGICATLRISNIEGWCNSNSDPYRSYISSSSLLSSFATFWKNNRQSIRRDTTHLLSNTNFDSYSIGLAYVGELCDMSWGYGVQYVTYFSTLPLQSLLFAHELGHNCNAQHTTAGTGHIMVPSGNRDPARGFASESISTIGSFLKRQTCLSFSGGTSTSTPKPTPRPITQPSTPTTTGTTTPIIFQSRLSSKWCMSLEDISANIGSGVILSSCNSKATHQNWYLDSNRYIRTRVDYRKCIVPMGLSTSDGVDLIVATCPSNYDARYSWYVSSNSGSGVIQYAKSTNMVIDVTGATAFEGATIQIWTDMHPWRPSWPAQEWSIVTSQKSGDDLVTSSPSNRPNSSPTSVPTKSPVYLASRTPTKSPIRTPTKMPSESPLKISSKSPTNAPTFVSPDDTKCTDKNYRVFLHQGVSKPCAWLTNFQGTSSLAEICSSTNAGEVCPSTCSGNCICSDSKRSTFLDNKGTSRTCQWVAWIKKFTERKKYCSAVPNASVACPGTCTGWCVFATS